MQCEIGVYGLGVMGAGIAKNMLVHGFKTAVYSVSQEERPCPAKKDISDDHRRRPGGCRALFAGSGA